MGAMAESTEGKVVIAASPAVVMDVLADVDAYPEWNEVRSVHVLSRTEGGRPAVADFEINVPILGRATFRLTYRYAPGDAGMSWVSTDAQGAVSHVDGEYLLSDLGDEGTEVTYRLRVDLAVLLPAFVRTRGEERVIANALEGLRSRVERDAA